MTVMDVGRETLLHIHIETSNASRNMQYAHVMPIYFCPPKIETGEVRQNRRADDDGTRDRACLRPLQVWVFECVTSSLCDHSLGISPQHTNPEGGSMQFFAYVYVCVYDMYINIHICTCKYTPIYWRSCIYTQVFM